LQHAGAFLEAADNTLELQCVSVLTLYEPSKKASKRNEGVRLGAQLLLVLIPNLV